MRWGALLLIVVPLTACAESFSPSSPTPTNAAQYFTETGHWVRGDFLLFYRRYGGVESLGHPITEVIQVDGWAVQYFEKGRLEFHPENEPAYRITVGWLGDLLNRRRPPLPPSQIPSGFESDRRYFPSTGHTVGGDFLRYFDAYGGTVRFGRPISEPFVHLGRLVQDFQSARFFWTPDHDPPVTLEAIGRVHFAARGLDKKLLEPVNAP